MNKGVRHMIFDWRERLKRKSNQELLQLFSETQRVNIDPQIYAGNLLFERKYKIDLLKERKLELINAIISISQTDIELDDAGRVAVGKLSNNGISSDEISCTYNEKGWLASYKQTMYHYKTGELTGVNEVKINYSLKDSAADSDREDSYTAMTIEDIYDENNELVKQVDGLKFRLKNSDGSWGAWKGTNY